MVEKRIIVNDFMSDDSNNVTYFKIKGSKAGLIFATILSITTVILLVMIFYIHDK